MSLRNIANIVKKGIKKTYEKECTSKDKILFVLGY